MFEFLNSNSINFAAYILHVHFVDAEIVYWINTCILQYADLISTCRRNVDRLIIGISRHPAVSATDRQMAPGAYNYNLEFVRFEISLFIAFW